MASLERTALAPAQTAEETPAWRGLATELDGVASGLEQRFVTAGNALERAYDLVERLIASLESVTNALDREAADRAIATMQANAARLARLPARQGERQRSLDILEHATATVQQEILRVDRTLDFLKICARYIKVAAAGAHGYSDFADAMVSELDVSEREIQEVRKDVGQLATTVPSVVEVNRLLASECARLCPHVPDTLAADALGLQQNQIAAADRADRIAAIARDIRTKLAAAHGAMQIGDITRQRLEHIAQGCRTLGAALEAGDVASDPLAAKALEGQVMALLAAQMADAAADSERETRILGANFRSIAAQVVAMLAMRDAGATHGGNDAAFFERLEQRIVEVDAVTAQLRDADTRSARLGSEASATVERLGTRLTTIYRVTADVQIMAWNTDLRSFRMGRAGDGLARIAAEIRGLVSTLEAISGAVVTAFEELSAAANAIVSGQESDAETGDPLAAALAVIREGALVTRQGMAGIDGDAGAIGDSVAEMTSLVDCDAAFTESLSRIGARLDALAAPLVEASEPLSGRIAQTFQTIEKTYSMARERHVHRRFLPSQDRQDPAPGAALVDVGGGEPMDEDDGLF